MMITVSKPVIVGRTVPVVTLPHRRPAGRVSDQVVLAALEAVADPCRGGARRHPLPYPTDAEPGRRIRELRVERSVGDQT